VLFCIYDLPPGGFFVEKIMGEVPTFVQTEPKRIWRPGTSSTYHVARVLAREISNIDTNSGVKMVIVGRREEGYGLGENNVVFGENNVVFAITNPQKLVSERRLLRVGAHDDDAVLGLINPGYATITATLTDGGQRDPDRFSAASLRIRRIEESIQADLLLNRRRRTGGLYLNYGLPDGELGQPQNLHEAVDHLGALIDVTKPDLVIAPHPDDEHPDHRAANEAARLASGNLPFYAHDTPTMLDRYGKPLLYTHVYSMTPGEADLRAEYYGMFKSQVDDIPKDKISEIADIRMVNEIPILRARQWKRYDLDRAGVLLQQGGSDLLTANHPKLIVVTGDNLALQEAA
jgi:LmbE family N-acetylglucosaminyl deacetylase